MSLCPGVDYTVNVAYPDKRRTLLTSTVGAWEGANAECPGRTYTGRNGTSQGAYKSTLSIPCNTTGGC
jgi:hypothetical protein